jgi:pimeloyl-ACP methyl ester carboxylesterase
MISKAWCALGLGILVVVAAVLAVVYVHRDIPASVLEAEYARPPSKFLLVDGVRMHYRDEGRGPTVVLIHGQFDSLLMWEPWAAALKSQYRVVRFDLTSHGLTGPDATGDYSIERTVRLLEDFTNQLHLGKFSIGGSAMGATAAVYYAARHPQRVDRLILISPEGLSARVSAEPASLIDTSPVFDVLAYTAPRLFAAGLLRNGFANPSRVTDQLVEERYELLRRAGNRQGELARIRQFDPANVESRMRALRSPVLVMFGEKGMRASVQSPDELRRVLQHAHSVRIDVIRGAGNMAVQEDPEGTARSAKEFLDAGHDNSPSPPRRGDPRFDREDDDLPMDSVYVTRAA